MNADQPEPLLLFPASVGERLDSWRSAWGYLDLKADPREGVFTVAKFSDRQAMRLPYTAPWQNEHFLRHADATPDAGVWYRCDPEVVVLHHHLRARQLAMPTAELASRVSSGWRQPPVDRHMLVVTLSRTDSGTAWSAWWVSRASAAPVRLSIVDDRRDPLDFLSGAWPVDELAGVLVTIVGVGSIGSAAAETLASSAVGRLALVDPDRLQQHNLARHRLTHSDLGRFKVNAMKDLLQARFGRLDIDPYPLDVAHDADVMRPLFAESDVIVCATDGVGSRRATNHLARRAGVPAVLAAVLEDGAIGEVLRVRNRTGCLLCQRRTLEDDGAIDPEPGLDLGYGTGSPHRPMTAAPGDLTLIGDLAAKAALATVLEARGRWNQRLPDAWALIGLQPTPDMPAPFDLSHAGEVRWHPIPDPRADCPTCAPP